MADPASDAASNESDARELRIRLPAGVLDAALASLATFAAGLVAVASFEDSDLGVYALFFSAFMLGTLFVSNLIFTPAQVAAVALPMDRRLSLLASSIRVGLIPGAAGALAGLVAMVVGRNYSTAGVIVPLVVSTGATIVLSPIQDHVRRMFHVADRSWRAATVSLVQVLVTCSVLALLVLLDAPVGWRPFGALALANALSLAVGLLLVPRTSVARVDLRELIQSGKWLLVESWVPAGAGFIVAAMIAALAGADALGHAEAARVVAQPVVVLATGLSTVLAPRAVEAAMMRDAAAARRLNISHMAIIGAAAVSYLAIAASDWAWNPMGYLLPAAYSVGGLVAVTILANVVSAALYLPVNELLGARRSRFLASVSALVTLIPLAVASSARVTGAFARPLGDIGDGLASGIAYRTALRRHYGSVD